MKTKIIILYLLIGITTSVFAQNSQSISGMVRDKQSGEPLPFVNISLQNTQYGTTTDSLGGFHLTNIPTGTYQLSASFVGYKTVFLTVNTGQSQLKIRLEEDAQALKEVVVTAKSEARKVKEEAMPTTVITMNQLSGKVSNISDILTKTSGVTIRNSGAVGSASRLSLRGLEGKRVGFFIDETPMADNSDVVDINDIPVDMIDRIEIYKGIVPARFGGSAMGGAVNIVLKEYPDKYLDVNYALQSFNTNIIQLILRRNLKEKGLVLGAGGFYTYSDNNYTMELPQYKGLKVKRNHDKFKKIVFGTAVKATKWWFDKVELEGTFFNTYKEIQGIKTDIRQAHTKSHAIVITNKLEKDNFFIEGLDFDMSSSLMLMNNQIIDTATIRYEWDGRAYPPPSKYGGEFNQFASYSDNNKMTFFNKLNIEYIINKQHSVSFNSVFTMANGYPKDDLKKLSVGKETLFNSQMRNWVSGLSYDFRTKDDIFLNSLTFRFYHYKMKTRQTEFFQSKINDIAVNQSDYGISNAMRYKFLPTLMGKLSIGRDMRIPNENELLGDGIFIYPAENLLPEKNTSVNLGLLYQQKEGGNLQMEISGFYMYLENMIRFTASFLGAQYQNFGKMQTLGVECEIKADIFPTLYGYINATYQDLRDVRKFEANSQKENPTKNKRMPNIPYLMANAGLEFHKENLFGGTGQNTRIFTDLSFIEEYLYDFEMTKKTKRRIPRSTTIDMGFEHSFMNERIFISGQIKNLTDAKVLSEFNRPLPGRNFGVKLRYIFK